MNKQPVISTEAQVLLKLLRFALGTEPRRYFGEPVEPFPTNINWKEVIRLSYEHKVSALAVDGLKLSGYDIFNGLNAQQTQELKPIVDNWFNEVLKTEQSYAYYVQVLQTLCQIYKANNLIPIILKGYGLSLNYTNPSHRTAGDIDLYTLDNQGNPAPAVGDRIARDILHLKVERKEGSKHSHFDFKGITVENHYELRSVILFEQSEIDFICTLHRTIQKGFHTVDPSGTIYIPSADFNQLYLIRHTFSDFHDRKPLLRQLCDYYYFLTQHSNSVNWQKVHDILLQAELAEFAAGIHNFLKRYLLANSIDIFAKDGTPQADELILNELFGNYHHGRSGIANIDYYYRNRDFYRLFHHQSWQHLTINQIKNHFKK